VDVGAICAAAVVAGYSHWVRVCLSTLRDAVLGGMGERGWAGRLLE
jgi:hypothetical protein